MVTFTKVCVNFMEFRHEREREKKQGEKCKIATKRKRYKEKDKMVLHTTRNLLRISSERTFER